MIVDKVFIKSNMHLYIADFGKDKCVCVYYKAGGVYEFVFVISVFVFYGVGCGLAYGGFVPALCIPCQS